MVNEYSNEREKEGTCNVQIVAAVESGWKELFCMLVHTSILWGVLQIRLLLSMHVFFDTSQFTCTIIKFQLHHRGGLNTSYYTVFNSMHLLPLLDV